MKKNNYVFSYITIACLVIVICILSIFQEESHAVYNYINKYDNNKNINYPYFNNKKVDTSIKKLLQDNNYYKTDYYVNIVNNYTSILFKYYDESSVVKYDYLLFDKDLEQVDFNNRILNIRKFKDLLYLTAKNNKLEVPRNLDINELVYYFMSNEIRIIYDHNECLNVFDINYNEFKDILDLDYKFNKEYISNINLDEKVYSGKLIAFTFDDGPSKYTEEILKVLEEYGANATFFEVGYMIKSRKDLVLDMYQSGYEIGNHTVDHSRLTKLKKGEIISKINDNNDIFKEITGDNMKLLRPPYGSYNELVKENVSVPIITWSVDSRDWESKNTDKIVELVTKETKTGDIVLFHDLYPTTVEAIKILVPYFYDNGYQIVSVSELFKQNDEELLPGIGYRKIKSE